MDPTAFRAALLDVPFLERDGWVDRVLGLDGPPDDGPELPDGCVPYLPCAADVLLQTVKLAGISPADVFVDVGSGVGRAAAVVKLLTGARVLGIEVQPALVAVAKELTKRLSLSNVCFVEGDVLEQPDALSEGTVFFLYCPFSGERVRRLLQHLEPIARARPIRICCVDVPLPEVDWLEKSAESLELVVYSSRSTQR